jgi:hypothetical protein
VVGFAASSLGAEQNLMPIEGCVEIYKVLLNNALCRQYWPLAGDRPSQVIVRGW